MIIIWTHNVSSNVVKGLLNRCKSFNFIRIRVITFEKIKVFSFCRKRKSRERSSKKYVIHCNHILTSSNFPEFWFQEGKNEANKRGRAENFPIWLYRQSSRKKKKKKRFTDKRKTQKCTFLVNKLSQTKTKLLLNEVKINFAEHICYDAREDRAAKTSFAQVLFFP